MKGFIMQNNLTPKMNMALAWGTPSQPSLTVDVLDESTTSFTKPQRFHDFSSHIVPSSVSIEITDITADLFKDAVFSGSGDWCSRVVYDSLSMIYHNYLGKTSFPGTLKYRHERDGYGIEISDTHLRIFGLLSVVIDTETDLIEDADKIIEVLDWLYEGGDCPLVLKSVSDGTITKETALMVSSWQFRGGFQWMQT